MNTARIMLCLAAASLGCVELQYADVGPDALAPQDVVDAADVRDAPDVTDAPRDTPADAADVRDASDVVDAADVRDVLDAPDVRDVVDVLDAPDVLDVPDVRDVPDVLDAPDVRDAPDVPVTLVDVVVDTPADVGPRVDVPVDSGSFTIVDAGLSMPTASYSQYLYPVSEAVDGLVNTHGWGIGSNGDGGTGVGRSQTAAFEFTTDTPPAPRGMRLVVALNQNLIPSFRLGRFRLSVTDAPRTDFCDGVATGGNTGATAIWSVPAIISATATGATLTPQGDGSIVASMGTSATIYTITLETVLSQLTGLRIEALADPVPTDAGPPNGGPGWGTLPDRGNFVLTEISVTVSSR